MMGRGDGPGAGAAGGPTRHVPVLLAEVCDSARCEARRRVHRRHVRRRRLHARHPRRPSRKTGHRHRPRSRCDRRRGGARGQSQEAADRSCPAASAISTTSRSAQGVRRASTASCSTSASRPCSSTRPSAASRSATTARSTCAWSATGRAPADLVNEASEAELADIFYHYGEERRARAVARADHRGAPPAALRDDAAACRSRRVADPAGAGRHPSGHARVPGAADRRQRRARRAGARAACGRAHPQARRSPRGRHVPFAGGPDREAVLRGPHRRAPAAARGTCRRRHRAEPTFDAVTQGPVGAERGGDRAQPARALGEAARRRAHRGAARRSR